MKATSARLEDFVDWTGIIASEPVEEEEMSSLVAGFATHMRKRAAGLEGETIPSSDGKRMKRSSPDEEAQKNWAIISVDSIDQASNDQPVLEGTLNEPGAPLEEGIPTRGPLNVDEIGEEAPSGVAIAPMLPPRLADTEPRRKRRPDRVLLSTYVPSQERIHLYTSMVSPNPEGSREIIHRWSPFNQAESPVVHMCDLYPNYFRVLMAARVKQYTIPVLHLHGQ